MPLDSCLGTLGCLPYELRSNIYVLCLTITSPSQDSPVRPRTHTKTDCKRIGIICTSKRICEEALPFLYQCNDFSMTIFAKANLFLTGPVAEVQKVRLGIACLHPNIPNDWITADLPTINRPMLRHLRRVVFRAFQDDDGFHVLEWRNQAAVAAKAREIEFTRILTTMHEAINILQACHRLDYLSIRISASSMTASIRKLAEPLMMLRGLHTVRLGFQGMTTEYRDHILQTMKLPRGAPAITSANSMNLWEDD
ncbi:hypothetical protein FH972_023072 [Carpinus fangiana]|uniref:Uncharacterized protein n=1 Tax=Carpinus fangiana TaxID=176857 RepID=A0A5N6KU40_9ROSI|nr:hypothetical protein FH972_023072 [Carpinus fangiana]